MEDKSPLLQKIEKAHSSASQFCVSKYQNSSKDSCLNGVQEINDFFKEKAIQSCSAKHKPGSIEWQGCVEGTKEFLKNLTD